MINPSTKVYWFIPDGVRGDWLFQLAEDGELPNIGQMIQKGVSGYSIPAFPSHTPTNYATLCTGSYPEVHGVSDGPIRMTGSPLTRPIRGFSSAARQVPAIWNILDDAGKKVIVFSVPGSTPPELINGITIRGRWSGWGVETPPILFTTDKVERNAISLAGFALTRQIFVGSSIRWKNPPKYFHAPKEIVLSAHGLTLYGFIYDNSDDGTLNYSHILFSSDKERPLSTLSARQWSEWIPVTLSQKGVSFESYVKIKIIHLSGDGKSLRIRFYFSSINRLLVDPQNVFHTMMTGKSIPAVDYVDDWPHQLVLNQA